tara:strand:+ start:2445 stop:3425 length:981 start_codon:yes stop_codon:yes gene_type:complete
MNKITLCICVYNGERYIEETLQSILRQSYKKFDILIVNDASTDNTVSIIDQFLSSHNIEYVLVNQDKNRGISFARHTALHLTKTKYMVFVDADDILHEDCLSKMYHKIDSDENCIQVGCYGDYIDEKGVLLKVYGKIKFGPLNKEEFFVRAKKGKLFFSANVSMFSVHDAKKMNLYEGLKHEFNGIRYQDYCEDLEAWSRLSLLYSQNKYMLTIPDVLYSYRKTTSSVSSSRDRMIYRMAHIKNNLKLVKANKDEISFGDFMSNLTDKKIENLEKDVEAANSSQRLNNHLISRKYIKSLYEVIYLIVHQRKYIYRKICANFKVISL